MRANRHKQLDALRSIKQLLYRLKKFNEGEECVIPGNTELSHYIYFTRETELELIELLKRKVVGDQFEHKKPRGRNSDTDVGANKEFEDRENWWEDNNERD